MKSQFYRWFIPNVIWNKYLQLQLRIRNLELLFDALVNHPTYDPSEGKELNGQRGRREIVSELLTSFEVDFLVETGTYLGDTAGYLASASGRPVYSAELDIRFYGMARKRLEGIKNVVLENLDSREFLNKLVLAFDGSKKPLFYLDAHWYEDLPLLDELRIVFTHWSSCVVVIDDFRVPNDPGYGYDDYGRGKTLDLGFLRPVLREFKLSVLFPSLHSSMETGAKRGCVVLISSHHISATNTVLKTLRLHDSSDLEHVA